ncbi:hypothetical protein D1007_45892 [Hordeum vulgare]|nr:hypothetical protein D1007_45892 [Hordeum vulgare]
MTDDTTALDVWLRIERYFLANRAARGLHLRRQFNNLQQGDLSIVEYTRRLKNLATALSDVGKPVSADDLIEQLLHGLAKPLHALGASIGDTVPVPDFETAVSGLSNAEEKMQRHTLLDGTSALVIHGGRGSQPHTVVCASLLMNPLGAPARTTPLVTTPAARATASTGMVVVEGVAVATAVTAPRSLQLQPLAGVFHPLWRRAPSFVVGSAKGRRCPGAASCYSHPGVSGYVLRLDALPPCCTVAALYAALGSASYPTPAPFAAPSLLSGPSSWDQQALFHQAYNNVVTQHPNSATDWIMDSGASSHVTGQQGNLSICHSPSRLNSSSITVGNGHKLPIVATGSTTLTHKLYPS